MKPKSLFPPKNNARKNAPVGPSADPNAGDPEDLQTMWNAVAALLDDTTVGGSASLAAPVAPPAARPATSKNPDAPLSDSALGRPTSKGNDALFAPLWSPKQTNNSPDQNDTEPSAPQPGAPEAPYAGPSRDGDAPATPSKPVRNGESLTPPYAPGVGPQILPAPDGYLDTPPTAPHTGAPHAGAPHAGTPSGGAPRVNGARGTAPVPLPRQPGEPFILPEGMEPHAVMIRGRNDGVGIEVGEGSWEDLLYVLSYRIEQTDGFFRGNHIAVDVANRHLNEAELNQMRVVMRSFGLDPSLLRTTSERTFQAALALGIPVSQFGPDGAPINEALPARSDAEGLGFFIYRGSLRSGQVLYRREHIVVIGDVNPGAEVVSDGDIMVWGRLRGIAHAGARGNNNAVITALDLDPVQLRIDQTIGAAQAGISATGPRWGANRSADRKAELARLINGKLTIQPWDEVKTGGVALLKRRLF